MKKYFRKILCRLWGTEKKLIYDIVDKDKYNVIFFDVFDTLIKRKVNSPTDVFDIVENSIEGTKNDLNEFKKNRILAEKLARKNLDYHEPTIDDIYVQLEYITKETHEKVENIKNIEIETEMDVCYPDIEMFDLYQAEIEKGKHVFIVTDMYLSGKVIGKLLEKNGYENYEGVYVSCEARASKRVGTIFPIILSELNVKGNIIHIGDNPLSDYFNPIRKGISAILIR